MEMFHNPHSVRVTSLEVSKLKTSLNYYNKCFSLVHGCSFPGLFDVGRTEKAVGYHHILITIWFAAT